MFKVPLDEMQRVSSYIQETNLNDKTDSLNDLPMLDFCDIKLTGGSSLV